jgi:hypothetical protein
VNDMDDLDELVRELGPTLRRVLRRAAAEITDDGPTTSPWASDHGPGSRPVQADMTLVELESTTSAITTPEHRPRHRMAAVILAAAAIVVVAVAGVALSRRDEKGADQQVEAVAESFMHAWVRGDGDAVAALLSTDGSFDAWTAETLPALGEWYRAMGWQYRADGCEVMSPERVSCGYTVENDLTRAFGRGPVAGSLFLDIEGGAVSSVIDDFNIAGYEDIWKAFAHWVRTHHPDDVDRMYAFVAGHALVDPASIALWSRHAGEFVESGGAYLARASAICTAAHERYDATATSAGSEGADAEAAAGILEDALVELRSVPPPEAVQERFDLGYTVLEQVVDSLRQLDGADAPASPAAQDLTNLLSQVGHFELGLEPCAFNPLS